MSKLTIVAQWRLVTARFLLHVTMRNVTINWAIGDTTRARQLAIRRRLKMGPQFPSCTASYDAGGGRGIAAPTAARHSLVSVGAVVLPRGGAQM